MLQITIASYRKYAMRELLYLGARYYRFRKARFNTESKASTGCKTVPLFAFFRLQEFWLSSSLTMFSHPRLLKCCQARIPPKFLKPEIRKHRQGSNFPKIPELPASIRSARAIVAQILGFLGTFDYFYPSYVFASEVAEVLPGSNFPNSPEA